MRIVHVAPFYTPVIGGVEEVVKRVAEFLAMRGYDVYVVTYNRLRQGGVSSLPRYENINSVHVIRLRPDFTWFHGSYSSELPTVLRELRPDIVHVHVWRHPHVFQVAKLKRRLGFKAVLHGHAPFHKLSQLGLATWLYHRFVDTFLINYLKLYDVYIALTPYEAEKAVQLGLRKDKVIIISNGVSEDNCRKDDVTDRDESVVLYLGRLSKAKNIDLLVKAMVIVSKAVNKASLVLAGPDEGIAKSLIEFARKRNIRLQYLSLVPEAVKHELYLKSYVYAFPSLYEPFGITLLEAAQHGLPSVITGSGGQLYSVPPNIASIWAKPNPLDYAQGIIELLTDKNLWKKISENAMKWSQNFLWSRILPKYEKLYNDLIA
jgi:glycosyltransferase involved in cell wall biosynthesis